MIFAAFEEEYLVTLKTCQSADWRACTALICKHAEQSSHQVEGEFNAMLATESAFPVRVRLRRRTACRITREWGTKKSIHLTGTATVPRLKAWLVMKLLPNPAKTPVAWQCRERRLGQVGFAHHTFRPRPPAHHTVCAVMKPCFDAVKQDHGDTTISL